ncbi:MAG: hypothetical protein ABI200_01375 [Gaiellales bacterium]
MADIRPILTTWRSTPWVAQVPVDDRTVKGILNEEVQIGLRGEGPMRERELVPLSAGARELLYGTHRAGAERLFRGVLSTLDGTEGVNNLRGFSLSTDQASFATNLLMSNVEAGFIEDAAARGDEAGFEASMKWIIPSAKVAKAQNTGWLDIGPRVSEKVRAVIEQGPQVRSDDATEVALTMLHELQHSVTPPDPNTIDDRHVWLEEGIAETLAWWPGQAAALRERIGAPGPAGEAIDPWSVPQDTVASQEYRNRHRTVQQLLGLAGVSPHNADGSINGSAHGRATQLLQVDEIERVPRNLARAITRQHSLEPSREPELREQILDVMGDPSALDTLRQQLGIRE